MDFVDEQPKKPFKIEHLSPEEKEKLVAAFVWLIEEDKKQNPSLYKSTKK